MKLGKKIQKIFINRVFQNSVAMTIVQITQYIVPFLMLALLTRRLGPDAYSLLAFIVAIVQFSNIVTDYGFYLSATEKLSKKRSSENVINYILGSVIICKMILFLIVSIFVILFANISTQHHIHKETIILSLAPIAANTFLPNWFFQGLEKMKYIMWVAISSKLTLALALWLFIHDASDKNLVLIFIASVNAVGVMFCYWVIYQTGYYPKFSSKHVRYTGLYGFQYFLARISSASFTSLNSIILGLFATLHSVASYSIALQFYTGLHSLFVPIYHAIYPYMARKRDINFLYKLLCAIAPALIMIAAIASAVFPYIIEVLVGPDFNEAIGIFNVMLVILIVNVISSFIGYPFFVAIGKNHIANYSIIAGALFHISIIALLASINKINAQNVVMVALAAETCILSIRLIFVRNYFRTKSV
ncbi:oligosaccharide flippase family protein [Planktomarina temperata]|nr:oligosaccharide flippase family protein [Planktomarina temperata]